MSFCSINCILQYIHTKQEQLPLSNLILVPQQLLFFLAGGICEPEIRSPTGKPELLVELEVLQFYTA